MSLHYILANIEAISKIFRLQCSESWIVKTLQLYTPLPPLFALFLLMLITLYFYRTSCIVLTTTIHDDGDVKMTMATHTHRYEHVLHIFIPYWNKFLLLFYPPCDCMYTNFSLAIKREIVRKHKHSVLNCPVYLKQSYDQELEFNVLLGEWQKLI